MKQQPCNLPLPKEINTFRLVVMPAFLLAISLLSSCVTFERCQEKFGKTAPAVKVPVLLTHVEPADNASFGVTRSELLEMEVGASKQAAGKKVKGKITKTSAEDYQVDCDTDTVRITVAGEVTCPPGTIFQPEPEIVQVTPWYNWLIIGALMAVIVFLFLRSRFSTPKLTYRLNDYEVDGYSGRNFPGHRNPPPPPSIPAGR